MAINLDTVADALRAKHTRQIDIERWQQPKHAHLLKSPAAFVDEVVAELSDDGLRGDPLPWSKCERKLRLRPHELTVWAGSNGSSKSTLLSEVMVSLANSGRRVVVASLEMPAFKVAAKMVAQAFANAHPARALVERWAERMAEDLCFLDFTGDIAAAEIHKLVRYCAHELGTHHILIDNLTKVVSADNEHIEQQRLFMARLHRAAIDTGMHVHLIAHTRKPAGDEDKPPSRYEVAGSRTLVDQPDNVVMIWRNRPKERKREKGDIGAIDEATEPDVLIRVEKQRYGRFEGGIGLWMDKGCWRFVEEAGELARRYCE